MTPERVAIYCRISRDQTLEGKGVERQEELCLERAEREGWEVVALYNENDTGASRKSKKPRPKYDELLKRAQAGDFDIILSYSSSRLTRSVRQSLDWHDLAETGRLRLVTLVSGGYDLTTPTGRALAITLAAWDANEAEQTGERVKAQKAQRAAEGMPQGGKWRVYGYQPQRDVSGKALPWVIDEDEAEIVREMFARKAAGESTNAIAMDLSARGIKTVAGNPWTQGTLARVFEKPGYCGRLLSNGQVIGKTAYPPIVSEALFDKATKNIVRKSLGANARKHLLTNFLVCSKCKNKMVGNSYEKAYKCNQNTGGCGSMQVKMSWTDPSVVWEVINREHGTAPEVDNTDEVQAQVDAVDAKIAEIEDAFDNDEIPIDTMTRLLAKQTKKRNELLSSVVVTTDRPRSHTFSDFMSLSLSGQRAVIGRQVKFILIKPRTGRGRGKFEPDRYEWHWQDGSTSTGFHADAPVLDDLMGRWGDGATYVERDILT
jgi:site-specific DNA recombinase